MVLYGCESQWRDKKSGRLLNVMLPKDDKNLMGIKVSNEKIVARAVTSSRTITEEGKWLDIIKARYP